MAAAASEPRHEQVPRHEPMVFVDDLDAPVVTPDDYQHLTRARRLRPGTAITACDGVGNWRPSVLSGDQMLEIAGPIRATAPARWPVTVAFTPVKGDRPEATIQHLTELGVDHIVVLKTDRSIVKWNEARAQRQLVKWRAIIRGACSQSRRSRIPEISGIVGLDTCISQTPLLALTDPIGVPMTSDHRAVAIGPEGGWSGEELEMAAAVSLPGENILRAETAALAAATLCAGFRSGNV